MRRTMIYIKDEQFLLLKKLAASSKRRMSEIIRDALSEYLRKKKRGIKYYSFVGIAEGPENGDASERAEEVLKEALK